MSIFSGIVVYIMIFWTVLFTVLPWGNRPHDEQGRGLAGSAPQKPRIGRKFLITGGISTIIWIGLFLIIHYNLFDLYEMGREMAVEDYGL